MFDIISFHGHSGMKYQNFQTGPLCDVGNCNDVLSVLEIDHVGVCFSC